MIAELVARADAARPPALFFAGEAPALREALQRHFGRSILVQRCPAEKRRRVLGLLPPALQPGTLDEMLAAHRSPDAAQALRSLQRLANSLEAGQPRAAAVLREGLEQTLTLQKLGLARRPAAGEASLPGRRSPAARRLRALSEPGIPAPGAAPLAVPGSVSPERRSVLGLEDRMQALRRLRLAQLLERPRLELAHALAREAERLADLLEGVLLLAAEAVAQAQDQLLARRQSTPIRIPTPARMRSPSRPASGCCGRRVGDEVLEPLLGAGDRRLERDRLAREPVERLERGPCRCRAPARAPRPSARGRACPVSSARTRWLRCSRSCTCEGSRIVREWFWIARTSA